VARIRRPWRSHPVAPSLERPNEFRRPSWSTPMTQSLRRCIAQALAMPLEERRARHQELLAAILDYDIDRWPTGILATMRGDADVTAQVEDAGMIPPPPRNLYSGSDLGPPLPHAPEDRESCRQKRRGRRVRAVVTRMSAAGNRSIAQLRRRYSDSL